MTSTLPALWWRAPATGCFATAPKGRKACVPLDIYSHCLLCNAIRVILETSRSQAEGGLTAVTVIHYSTPQFQVFLLLRLTNSGPLVHPLTKL